MNQPFDNKVVLITGAASGIGRELAMQMSRLGAVIAALDLRQEPLEALVTRLKESNGAGAYEVGDVTRPDTLHDAVGAFSKRLGPVEILVANAGIGIATPADGFNVDDVKKQIDVNLIGVANSIGAVLPGMLERGRGQLVAIASLASFRGLPMMSGYCASKAGVVALMDGLRLELKPRGIACTTICPGWIRTPLTENIPVPKPGLLELEDAVRRIVQAIVAKKVFAAFPPETRWPLAIGRMLPVPLSDWITLRYLRRHAR